MRSSMTKYRIEYSASQTVEVDAQNVIDALNLAMMKQDDRKWRIRKDCLVLQQSEDGEWVNLGVFGI